RIGRLLEGDRSATMVLDTNKLTELSDRALREDAEEAFPSLAQEIEAVLDEPIRALTLEVDQDGWPRAGSGALELVMDMGASGSARLLLAAYVEGATWKASFDLEERPPSAFFGSEKPRVDARFIWGSRHLPLRCGRDASDLGEQPLTLQLELDEFALPSLRRLMAQRSAISLWDHSGAEPVELSATRIDMRLIATVRSVTLLGGVCVWRSRHEREESVLLGCTPVATFETQIQREIWLGAHRRNGLRQAATTQDRRRRLVEAICSGAPVAAADHWTAFHLLVGRARSAKLRRSNAEARASYVRALDYGLALCHSDEPGYVNAMKLWDTAMALVALLRESGDEAAQRRYATAAVEFARSLMRREPAEADYARALSQALLARAELAASSVEVVGDLEEAASLMFELADSRDDLPWRRTDAQQAAERAAALWPKELVCPNAWRSRHPERQIGR
ncbi:MAG TPA: hypothetical protein VHM25_12620, partial [Polyangiaceae bacterium]|nr:hypothetical protein [Polyangiaceae bacterium]